MTPSAMSGSRPAVRLHGITKSFDGARALDHADLSIERGEIHGLLGENGSGKSTLIKILAGFYTPDEGEFEMNGEQVRFPMPPGRSTELGMGFVHQDLALIPSLSVLENLRIGEMAMRSSWRLSWGAERRRARETLGRYGLLIDPRAKVSELRPTERAQLAIVRAVEQIRHATAAGSGVGLLVLDEVTVFLPAEDKQRLFALIREVARSHASILFVSHDLDEALEITDRVTILRDGRVQGTVRSSATSISTLVEMIVGRALATSAGPPKVPPPSGGEPIRVRGLSAPGLRHVSLDIGAGEVLGLTGLPGTGFDVVPYALGGAIAGESGELTVRGERLDLRNLTPLKALDHGIALLPADRLQDGSSPTLPVEDNAMLPVLRQFRGPLGLNRRRVRAAARKLLHEFDVRPPDPRRVYQNLSGGNQQKVLVGKWLQMDLALWLLHEPTQGVDVGARQQIFRSIRTAAAGGMAVVCASNDHEQLADICDRVVVFGLDGRLTELVGDQFTKHDISEACFRSPVTTDKQ
jgi:ribose transport system ATP-binding protein